MPQDTELQPEETDASQFVQDLIKAEGYYTYPEGSEHSGGHPSTEQELSFILNFMQEQGRAPTIQELDKGFLQTTDMTQWEYLPGSTPYEQGFRNYAEFREAQKAGETYGPSSGSLVPEDGVVLTRDGNPWLRTFNPAGYQGAIQGGRYLTPPGGLPGAPPSIHGEAPTPEMLAQYYPQYAAQGPFPGLSMEDAMKQYGDAELYLARLNDYLAQQVSADAPNVQKLKQDYDAAYDGIDQQLGLGAITRDEAIAAINTLTENFNTSLGNYMTSDRVSEIIKDATAQVQQGGNLDWNTLPYYQPSQGVMGQNINEMYNRASTAAREKYQAGQKPIPKWEGYEPFAKPIKPTGSEQAEYLSYVNRLDVSPEWKQYMSGQFWNLYSMWETQPEMPFLSFIKSYLASGGKR